MSDGPPIYATEALQVYLDDAASKKPAPGGGSVSACVGALGAALVAMVCNLTQGREKFAAVETEIVATIERDHQAESCARVDPRVRLVGGPDACVLVE